MVKKRGLGKSLNALLSYTNIDVQSITDNAVEAVTRAENTLSKLPLNHIQRGKYQPRRDMQPQALEELANSIRTQGILQPIIVRPIGDKYEIIAGERRWRAAELAGLTEVPVIIRHVPDEAAMAIALIENIQRENLNPIEEAIALQRLSHEFAMTHQQLAEAVGKSRASVTNLLRLLTLPEEIKRLLEAGQLEMGHARAILALPDNLQKEACQTTIARRLSVRETENLVRQLQSPIKKSSEKTLNPDLLNLQEDLTRQLKLRVAIQCNAKGKGKLVIHYRSLAELDSLLSQFQD